MEKIDIAYKRWQKWGEKIGDEISIMLSDLEVYNKFAEVFNLNKEYLKKIHGIRFCDCVRRWYGLSVSTAVRRHLKYKKNENNTKKSSISLMRLLHQLSDYSEQFTYEFFLKQIKFSPDNAYDREDAYEIFNENYSDDGKALSKTKIQKDINEIKAISKIIEEFVDKKVAHLDENGPTQDATFNDLVDSIKVLDEIASKYLSLINVPSGDNLKPFYQSNWIIPLKTKRKN